MYRKIVGEEPSVSRAPQAVSDKQITQSGIKQVFQEDMKNGDTEVQSDY